eukprot:m51a1_g2843 putative histidine kinase (153) ;mRNA; f:282032-282690
MNANEAEQPLAPVGRTSCFSSPDIESLSLSNILVAEDDPVQGHVLKLMLAKLGYKVTIATDGHSAVSLFITGSGTFSCIVMDNSMPGLTGLQAVRTIRAHEGGCRCCVRVRIVALSSDHIPETEWKAAGADVALRKPAKLAELAAAIRGGDS